MNTKLIKLLIASSNPGKLLEISALLDDLPVELVTPLQLDIQPAITESGSTYAQNAAIKAQAYWHLTGLPTLADDSGLEVDILAGLPGIHSARFSPIAGASDEDRRAHLLAHLRDKPRPWTARFRCTVALVTPAGELIYSEGACEGEVIPEERGKNGFGYDPIFLLSNLDRTMAELSPSIKNTLSHRARAVQGIKQSLTKLITGLV
jgi:XTP/dITP diphosphohydrolase